MIAKPSQTEAAKRLNPLEIITLILSIYVLVALLIQLLISLPPDAVVLLDRIDWLVCIVFLTDFFVRFTRAPSKLGFLKWGWIDFVSSIPVVGVFRVGRVVRIIRVVRLLRAFRSTKNLLVYLLRERKITSLAAVTTISLVLVIFAAIGVLQFEDVTRFKYKDCRRRFLVGLRYLYHGRLRRQISGVDRRTNRRLYFNGGWRRPVWLVHRLYRKFIRRARINPGRERT